MNRSLKLGAAAIALFASILGGCMRGGTSSAPPVHLVQDMDFQPKLRAQSKTDFAGWRDGRSMRVPVADAFGTTLVVARGSLPARPMPHRDASNQFVKTNPLPLDAKLTHLGREVSVLERGRERFEIHCAICHGYSGQGSNDPKLGHGLVGRRWPAAIPSFHMKEATPGAAAPDNRVPQMPDGEYFDVITNGKGTMPPYGMRLSVEDRWAIVHYVRALQSLSTKN